MRGTDVPTMVYLDGSLGVAVPLIAVVNGTSIPSGVVSALSSTLKFLSPINWAYETFPLPSARLTTPSRTDRLPAGTLSCLDARSSSALRASAAAWRRLPPASWIVTLADVGNSCALRAESPITRFTWPNGTSSSSGDDLRERGLVALSELDLRSERGDAAVSPNVQPGIEMARVRWPQVRVNRGTWRRLGQRGKRAREGDRHDQGASAFEKDAS